MHTQRLLPAAGLTTLSGNMHTQRLLPSTGLTTLCGNKAFRLPPSTGLTTLTGAKLTHFSLNGTYNPQRHCVAHRNSRVVANLQQDKAHQSLPSTGLMHRLLPAIGLTTLSGTHIPTAETNVQPARMHTHNRLALQSRSDLDCNARRSLTGP